MVPSTEDPTMVTTTHFMIHSTPIITTIHFMITTTRGVTHITATTHGDTTIITDMGTTMDIIILPVVIILPMVIHIIRAM